MSLEARRAVIVTLLVVLQIGLIVLKFMKLVAWSWLWILLPLWIPVVALLMFVLVVAFIVPFGEWYGI